jgi:hypothetical protein
MAFWLVPVLPFQLVAKTFLQLTGLPTSLLALRPFPGVLCPISNGTFSAKTEHQNNRRYFWRNEYATGYRFSRPPSDH